MYVQCILYLHIIATLFPKVRKKKKKQTNFLLFDCPKLSRLSNPLVSNEYCKCFK